MDSHRQSLSRSRRIVVKVGSGVLVDASHRLDEACIHALVVQLSRWMEQGRQPVLVTSGAVAAGAPAIGLAGRGKTIPQKQACAAIGQGRLMAVYERLFSARGRHTAQILLTQDDVRDRGRYLNARNTMETLLAAGILPIVNENDTVAVEEIKFGDNDNLSAQVSALLGADLLVILSAVAGLFERPPSGKGGETPLPLVERIEPRHFGWVCDVQLGPGALGSGGMAGKLAAIHKAGQYGVPVVLADGRREAVLDRILEGQPEGTLFLPAADRLSARKHWILHTLVPQGHLSVDEGAVRALASQGKSLLPIGIRGVEGHFRIGDSVRILGPDGHEMARGLVNYSAEEAAVLCGARSEEIESRLGYRYDDEVVHRDNLVLLLPAESPTR